MTNEAVCVLLTKGDLVLAVARRGTEDQWGLAGGKVDPGEDKKDAAIRELKEETGIVVLPQHLSPIFEREENGYHSTTFLYHGTAPTMDLSGDAGPVKLITWEELINGPFGKYNRELKLRFDFDQAVIEWAQDWYRYMDCVEQERLQSNNFVDSLPITRHEYTKRTRYRLRTIAEIKANLEESIDNRILTERKLFLALEQLSISSLTGQTKSIAEAACALSQYPRLSAKFYRCEVNLLQAIEPILIERNL
jgi:8-oxo-dGTP pyrophosphatase MutT (NUDIX family)